MRTRAGWSPTILNASSELTLQPDRICQRGQQDDQDNQNLCEAGDEEICHSARVSSASLRLSVDKTPQESASFLKSCRAQFTVLSTQRRRDAETIIFRLPQSSLPFTMKVLPPECCRAETLAPYPRRSARPAYENPGPA